MDDSFKILKKLFLEHYIELVVLAISWIFIYYILKCLDLLARKILLRLPFYLEIRLRRIMIGASAQRNKMVAGKMLSAEKRLQLFLEIERLHISIDEKISKIKSGQHWVTKILRPESIEDELQEIKTKDWALLESDYALCEAISTSDFSARGLRHFIGNPRPQPAEKYGLLIHSVRFGPEYTQVLARYFIDNVYKLDQLRALRSLASQSKQETSEIHK
ncbi:MAG TPA: hypothetical protein VF553_22120 [Pyrinomonadaceae bacterium]|jgi:hypothetical protein